MPSPSTFWPQALPWAKEAKAAVPSLFISVILAQWAVETGYGGTDWSPNNNPGNVGSYDGQPVATFPTLQQGVAAYIQTIQLPYYTAVRAATDWRSQAVALGESPWASAHYALPGGSPGSELVWVIENYGLTQYDAPTPPPAPPATLKEGETMTSLIAGGQIHVYGVIGNNAFHWWQQAPTGDPAHPADPTWHVEQLPA